MNTKTEQKLKEYANCNQKGYNCIIKTFYHCTQARKLGTCNRDIFLNKNKEA